MTVRLVPKLAVAAAAATLIAAAPASAATVSVATYSSWEEISFVAAGGEANRVVVEKLSDTTYRVTDEAPLTAGRGCTLNATSKVAMCTASMTAVSPSVWLKDRDDTLTLLGDGGSVDTGAGDDRVAGGPNFDNLRNPSGEDRLAGNGGGDMLETVDGRADGGDGDDQIHAGAGGTTLDGGSGDDTLSGGSGTDLLRPGYGADVVVGGPGGDDTVFYDDHTESVRVTPTGRYGTGDGIHPETPSDDGAAQEGDFVGWDVENVVGGSGDDRLFGSEGSNALDGGPGNDVLSGDGGDDVLGQTPFSPGDGRGDDALVGGYGSDRLVGGLGNDTLTGFGHFTSGLGEGFFDGASRDLVSYAERPAGAGVRVSLDAYANDGGADNDLDPSNGLQRETDRAFEIEDVEGGAGDDTLTGDRKHNVLLGRDGDDTLRGKDGPDRLGGTGGYAFEAPAPVRPAARGTSDDDKLYGGEDHDDMKPGLGRDDVLGGEPGAADGAGNDTVDYSDRSTPLRISLDNVRNDGAADVDGNAGNGAQPEGDFIAADVEDALSGSGNDVLAATLAGQANLLDAGAGKDVVRGGPGDDVLDGGSSPDGNAALDGGDEIHGGIGVDTVTYGDRSEPVNVALEYSRADDGEAGEKDWIVVFSTDAVENVIGGDGGDTLVGSAAGNSLDGGDGDDLLFGRAGNDSLLGGFGADALKGEADADRLLSRGDGTADANSCGGGTSDVAVADDVDTFPARNDCETRNPT